MTSISKVVSPIIILGMHRSGTSCLAGTLQQAGVNLGEVSNNNKFNPKGNKENSLIMSLNDDLLKYNNATWHSPPEKVRWTTEHISRGLEISNLFNKNSLNQTWGFKDPRTLITFDFWNTLFPNATLIGSIRSPSEVARSLNKRENKIEHHKGLSLWLQYNLILLKLIKQMQFPLVSFDLSNDAYKESTTYLVNHLFPDNLNAISDFFEKELRTNNAKDIIEIPTEVSDCYGELQSFLYINQA